MSCGKCHTCNTELKYCLDGEEWCENCKTYRRYIAHGWSKSKYHDNSACGKVKSLDYCCTKISR